MKNKDDIILKLRDLWHELDDMGTDLYDRSILDRIDIIIVAIDKLL